MNFFKSILSEDPVPLDDDNSQGSDDSPRIASQDGGASSKDFAQEEDSRSADDDDDNTFGDWSFGGLMKTFAARSESMIETYRRDLKEFGSGLKSETYILREVASKVVKDLPASLEAGALALDGVIKSTAEIISKENLVPASKSESRTPETSKGLNSGRYSWFESQLNMIQNDDNTFCQDPDDADDYKEWKLGFGVENKGDEIEGLLRDSGNLKSVYDRAVPNSVDHRDFWCRYFYRLEKLKYQDQVRAKLMRRANSADVEEDLSWEVDEDDSSHKSSEENSVGKAQEQAEIGQEGSKTRLQNTVEASDSMADKEDDKKVEIVQTSDVSEVNSENEMAAEGIREEKSNEKATVKLDNEDNNGEKHQSVKKDDVATKVEEEDMGWDEIEDVGSDDEKKVSNNLTGSSENRADIRKRLSVAEDDEDLNWDIEDDDEPLKA